MKNKLHISFLSLLVCFITVCTKVNGQYNLVPNPSFEVFDTCPNNLNQLRYATSWTNPIYPGSTPDYYNGCDTINQWASVPINQHGFEMARSGVGYSYIATAIHTAPNSGNYREYIQTQLTDSLIAATNYCIQFYVSACDSCLYTSNNIGVYFSHVAIHDSVTGYPFNLPFIPQFENPSTNNLNSRNGWTEISGTYTALGGEKFVIIGNFRDSNTTVDNYTGWGYFHWAGYYIDDVLITPCDSLTAIQDIQIINNGIRIINNGNEISIESKNELIRNVSVYSITGQIIHNSKPLFQKSISIDCGNWAKSIYIITVFTNKNYYHRKCIIN